ncbi:2Fe-2S iron-sulfur cluster-binding protein [Streptomyces sp. NPDC126522]|uniref:2Fe-2S iron-sulfur cluster-binding protein n=1 Tax=Streptomyces sp. NPDC126522 TaxID=3155211 RepID=UPI00332B32DC
MKPNVNRAEVEVDDAVAASPLLWVLRDVLGLRGTKYGCGIGACAACTVLIDGRNTKACRTPAARATGKAITTVEAPPPCWSPTGHPTTGPVSLTDVDCREISHPDPMSLCRRGHSANKPFCEQAVPRRLTPDRRLRRHARQLTFFT